MAPSGGDNDQTAARSLAQGDPLSAAVAAGETVDLGGARLDADRLRKLILAHALPASVDGPAAAVTPFGVRIRNAEIVGRLDLEGADIPFPLVFSRITMEAGGQNGSILLRDARIRRLSISNATLAGGIIADRAQFENGVMISGGRIGGPLAVRGGEIGGALAVEGAHLGDDRIALLAAGVRIRGPLVLRRAQCHGEVRLQRAHLEAGLRADEMEVTGDEARLYCDAARIGGITPFLKAMAAAEHARVDIAPHWCMELHIHLAAAYPQEPWIEHFHWLEPIFEERLIASADDSAQGVPASSVAYGAEAGALRGRRFRSRAGGCRGWRIVGLFV